jgi:hypothetical protein
MFANCANNPIYIPNGGECDDCSQLENRVGNLEEAMTEVQEELPDKQDKLTAGEGIFITPDGIISTTGSSIKVEITGNDPYYSSDKTFSEILAAYNNGDTIVANYQGTALSLQSISQTEAVFASTDSDGNLTFFTITNGNDILSKTVDSVFLVTLTNPVEHDGYTQYTSDRKASEIQDAVLNGSNVYIKYTPVSYPTYVAYDSGYESAAYFSGFTAHADKSVSFVSFTVDNYNTAIYSHVNHGIMEGASASRDGYFGLVPPPAAGDEEKFLKGDGTWAEVSGGCCAEEASGNPIILTDAKNMNAQSLEVDFEPIQDLNGYDYAWAGGNRKNKFDYNGVRSLDSLSNNNGTFTNTNTDTRTGFSLTVQQYNGTNYIKGDAFTISESGRYSMPITIDTEITKLRIKHNGAKKDFTVDYPFTGQGAYCLSLTVISANPTVVGGLVFKDIMLEIGSTATEYEPYENICPISGAESVTVKRTGKNLLQNIATTRTINGLTFTVNSDGSVAVNGTATRTTTYNINDKSASGTLVQNLNGLEGQTVILSGCPSGGSSSTYRLAFARLDGSTFNDCFGDELTAIVGDITEVNAYVRIQINEGYTANNLTFYPMIRPASISDSTYEPYIAQTVSINLGGEYYGGTLDMSTGELEVYWKTFIFYGSSDEEWSQEAIEEGTTPTWPLSHGIELEGVDATVKPYCSTYETKVGTVAQSEWAMVGVYSPSYPANRTYLDVRPAVDYSTGNAWRDYLAANPLTVVAKLKEPIKVQLVSAQLELLEKYNVLTTNGELITLSYMPDCYCGVTKTSQLLGLTHIMDGKANGSLRSNTAFPDGVIERGGQSMDGTLGNFATALGAETMATGMGAFAHGMMTMASGTCAHAEGAGTAATGGGSHAEGEQTVASGARSHAEGLSNTASGSESHVSGALSEASAAGAFAHGQGLKASSPLQTVFGKYNVEDSNSEYAFIIGNGTSSNRSNLFAIKWDGTIEINGQALLPANGNSF